MLRLLHHLLQYIAHITIHLLLYGAFQYIAAARLLLLRVSAQCSGGRCLLLLLFTLLLALLLIVPVQQRPVNWLASVAPNAARVADALGLAALRALSPAVRPRAPG